jgi:tRNA (adenine58-N1)-methyltransferase non-catalytic subunit
MDPISGEHNPSSTYDNGAIDPNAVNDPLLRMPPTRVREGEYALLLFADGRQILVQCITKPANNKKGWLKLNKKTYSTASLVGLSYGTVLELTSGGLVPLPPGEGVLPEFTPIEETAPNDDASADDTTFPPILDNRHLVDDNTSQALNYQDLQRLKESGTDGSVIVSTIIQNSSTYDSKTEFSKAKYVARKQLKYQLRTRLVRCTAATVCQAMYSRDPKRLLNMRDDTLAQILSYSNVSAGCQVLVFEESGIITGALAERLGGYGRILAMYQGQQPGWTDMFARFNLSFAEQSSIKFLHAGDVFAPDNDPNEFDEERAERDVMEWPCPLQPHTRKYLKTMDVPKEREQFLAKRCTRFARKLTRPTPLEVKQMLTARPCESIIIATRCDPTATLRQLLPYLAPSCPFVVYSEFIEPLAHCFQQILEDGLAINLRLSDTWTRGYQVLPGRTHPNMNMSQSGGFLLVGIKLDPETGKNELDDTLLKEIRAEIGGRRGKKKAKPAPPCEVTDGGSSATPEAKRQRT